MKKWFTIVLFAQLIVACKNEKTERKLVGNWLLINSKLSALKSNTIVNQSESLGNISLFKDKIDNSILDLNKGSWSFINFPDTIIPLAGNLSWSSTDKGDFNRSVPWEIELIFSQKYVKDYPVQGSYDFNCYRGKFLVTELKKKEHYKISGNLYMLNRQDYLWEFELKKK